MFHVFYLIKKCFKLMNIYVLIGEIMCYGLNVCISPKFICWNSNAPWNGIRNWGLGEVIRLWGWTPYEWNEYPYKKRPERASLPLSRCEATVRNQQFTTGLGSHQNLAMLCTLILGFQPLELWEINYYCFWTIQFVLFCYSSPHGLRH